MISNRPEDMVAILGGCTKKKRGNMRLRPSFSERHRDATAFSIRCRDFRGFMLDIFMPSAGMVTFSGWR